MKNWTESAHQRLATYLVQRPQEWGLEGEAATELATDLRAHVYEELEDADVEVVTLEELERVLEKLGGTAPQAAGADLPVAPAAPVPLQHQSGCGWFLLQAVVFVGCVLSPVLAVVLESLFRLCATTLFDPLPTCWHGLVVAATVAVTACSAQQWINNRAGLSTRWTVGLGFAWIVALYYGVLFLPVSPVAVVGVIFGVGLLALSPLFAAAWLWCVRRRMLKAAGHEETKVRRHLRWGMALGIITLLALEVPNYLTRYGLGQASRLDPDQNQLGVKFLRQWGSEARLRTICSESGNRPTDAAGWVQHWLTGQGSLWQGGGSGGLPNARYREIYYQVTGRSFSNERPPTTWNTRQNVSDLANDAQLDDARGGDSVAMKLSGLALKESRLDVHLEAPSELGYIEWTCVFSNSSTRPREARFQVQLPPQSVGSRLTLWVNDEPREAAFSKVSQVKAAYRNVVQVERRDPVMVNVCGPDRVFVQCFPVPVNGTMQIRLGITAPLADGKLRLPSIVEENFSIPTNLKSPVWVQADAPFTCTWPDLASVDAKGFQTMTVPWNTPSTTLQLTTDPTSKQRADSAKVWTTDPFAPANESFLTRTWETKKLPPLGKPIYVVDGGKGMQGSVTELQKLLGHTEVIFAGDQVQFISMSRLTEPDFQGGTDNAAALAAALDHALQRPGSVIVWLHGPQPVMLSSQQSLLQKIERGRAPARIYDVPLSPGPNRIAEALLSHHIVHAGPVRQELATWIAQLEQPREQRVAKYERGATQPTEGKQVWDQLARYAVYDDLMQHVSEPAPTLTETAAKYHLITPWSGAVVLETQQQYDQFSLTPGDPQASPSVPLIPEPSTLTLLGSLLWWGLRRRRNRNYRPVMAS